MKQVKRTINNTIILKDRLSQIFEQRISGNLTDLIYTQIGFSVYFQVKNRVGNQILRQLSNELDK